MSHQRISPWRVAFEALVGAAIIVVLFRLGQPPPPLGYIEQEPIVHARPTTMPEVEPDAERHVQPQVTATTSDRSVRLSGGGVPLCAEPLTFRGPEGVLVIRWETNWDAVEADCMRKLWALRSRDGAPDTGTPAGNFPRHRDDRFGAAYKACPEFRR